MTLVAESTTGVMHAAESSTYSHAATPTSAATALPGRMGGATGNGGKTEKEAILPEDVGKNTASLLIQEIIKVYVSRVLHGS